MDTETLVEAELETDPWAETRLAMEDAATRLVAQHPDKASWLAWFAGQASPEKVSGIWNQACRLVAAVQQNQPLPARGDVRGWAALLEPDRDVDAPPPKRR